MHYTEVSIITLKYNAFALHFQSVKQHYRQRMVLETILFINQLLRKIYYYMFCCEYNLIKNSQLPRNGCDARLIEKNLKIRIQVNLCCLFHSTLGLGNKIHLNCRY